jgi:hypothetical protein
MAKLVPEWLQMTIASPEMSLDELIQAKDAPSGWLSELQIVAERLKKAKTALDGVTGSSEDRRMREALRSSDLYGELKSSVRSAKGQAPTNAWLKMWEMISHLRLLPTHGTMSVFCNAELPGAFVSALHHYSLTHGPIHLEWAASSLWPGPTDGALGDSYGLAAGSPDRWLMDPDMRGDLTDVRDVARLVDRVRARVGLVDLYCSDGGVDVKTDFNRQEELSSPVHLGQVVTGMAVLRPGGTLIVKTFMFTSPWSVSVLGVCGAVFQDVCIVKPVTSRSANSEVYIVGRGFLGVTDQAMTHLLRGIHQFDFSVPLVHPGALQQMAQSIVDAAKRIHGQQQVAYLREVANLATADDYKERLADISALGKRVRATWRKAYPIPPLPKPLPTGQLTAIKRKR